MNHWQPFGDVGFVHISTATALPTVRMTRRDKKHYVRLEKLLARRVQLGPVLVGEFKMRKALKRGAAYAGR